MSSSSPSLSDTTYANYEIGFPRGGHWFEAFNSDVYDHWVNPLVAGNGGQIDAGGTALHGFPASAALVIPANGVLLFTLRRRRLGSRQPCCGPLAMARDQASLS